MITKFHKGEELIESLCENRCRYDVVFLAVNPKGMNGIRVAREIRNNKNRVPIIIVSESEDHYRAAFDIYAWQYLLKPVRTEKLLNALRDIYACETDQDEEVITFTYSSRVLTLKLQDILYISSRLHSVFFHMKNGTELNCRGKLQDFDGQLEGTCFVRCHQSFYINMNEITDYRRNSVSIEGTEIPVSLTYMKTVQEAYDKFLKSKS